MNLSILLRPLGLMLLAALAFGATPARADWLKAESPHFIVYSDGSERDLREYVNKLETFDYLLRLKFNRVEQGTGARKLPIYLLRNRHALEQVHPRAGENVVGVYMPVGEDIFAIAQRDKALAGDQVLFHEYVHHFMLENFPGTYPGWFVEGFAEYYMTAEIDDGQVKIGGYSTNRVSWLFNGSWLPLEDLLSKRPAEIVRSSHQATYYPVAWLLAHWFLGDPARLVQLDAYLNDVAAGGDPVEAMQRATGMDMNQLRLALRRYMRGRIPMQILTFDFPESDVTVTRLPDSANDLLLLSQRLKVGVDEDQRTATAESVRLAAARHPDDPFAMLTLGHAELHFGDHQTGVAVLQALLEKQPDNVEALQFMAVARMSEAEEHANRSRDLLIEARGYLARAYRIDEANYYTLYLLAKSRSTAPSYPNENDITTWLLALDRAPQWPPIRLGAAAALIEADRREAAIALLQPIANGPHGGPSAAAAQAMILLAASGAAPPDLAQIEADAARDGLDSPPPPDAPAPTGTDDAPPPEDPPG